MPPRTRAAHRSARRLANRDHTDNGAGQRHHRASRLCQADPADVRHGVGSVDRSRVQVTCAAATADSMRTNDINRFIAISFRKHSKAGGACGQDGGTRRPRLTRIAAFRRVCYHARFEAEVPRGRTAGSWRTSRLTWGRDLPDGAAVGKRAPPPRAPVAGWRQAHASTRSPQSWTPGCGPVRPRPRAASVAVLPFVNLTADRESEYFGDGLADEVINALTRIPGLRVTARTSSFAFSFQGAGRARDRRAARGGGAAGSSIRKHSQSRSRFSPAGQRRDGFHLWSESYDRELPTSSPFRTSWRGSIALALKVHWRRLPWSSG